MSVEARSCVCVRVCAYVCVCIHCKDTAQRSQTSAPQCTTPCMSCPSRVPHFGVHACLQAGGRTHADFHSASPLSLPFRGYGREGEKERGREGATFLPCFSRHLLARRMPVAHSSSSAAHPSQAGSQFFVCLGPLASLDNKYTTFGKLVKAQILRSPLHRDFIL